MKKYPLIRTIYLYLFALVGLVMVTIGTAGLVTLGLKTYVFTAADEIHHFPEVKPLAPPEKKTEEEVKPPTREEIDEFNRKQRSSQRQREAAESLGFIIVGLSLYLYHWSLIKRDKRLNSEVNK